MKKRNDGRYQLSVPLSDGTRKLVYGKTIAEVKEKSDMLLKMDRQGLNLDDDTLLGEWAIQWFDVYKSSLRTSTKESYRNALNTHILPIIGNMRMRDVKPIHCQKVMRNVAKKAEDTQKKVLHTMQQLFHAAQKNGLTLQNPAEDLKITPITRDERKKSLTPDEQKILLHNVAQLDDQRALRLVATCIYAGTRREEVLGLFWSDLQEDGLHIQRAYGFPTNNMPDPDHSLKTKAAYRVVPVPDKLRKIYACSRKTGVFVIGNADGGEPTFTSYRRLWEKVKAVSPVPGLTIHMLRHTYVTNLWRAGIDLKTAQVWAGHSNISVTAEIYTHADMEGGRKIAAKYFDYIENL